MKKNLKKALEDKLEQARDFFNVKLNSDDPDLVDQITLGDNWDNPSELSKALDMQPAWYSRWAYVLRKLERERDRLQLTYDVWKSGKLEVVRDKLVKKRRKQGLTEKQSLMKITQIMVENKFNIDYNYDNIAYKKYKSPLDKINENIDEVKLIVEAFKQRKETLVALSYLVKSMIENNLLIHKRKKQK